MAYSVLINPISPNVDGIITAAEMTGGITITGTTSAGGAVTLNLGGQNRTATVTGTTWSYTLSAADFTNMGQGAESITATAGFAGGQVATANRIITVDTVLPTLVITSDAAGTANGLVTYTFTFSEPVTGFFDLTASKIAVVGGTKKTFTMLSSTVYTLAVLPPAGGTGNIDVSVLANKAVDTVGNGNVASVAATQAYDTTATAVPPVSADLNTVAITYVADNHGTVQGDLLTMPGGSTTSDNRLELSGTLGGGLSAGDVVKVFDGATALGNAAVSGNTWVYLDSRVLNDAQTVNYTVQVVGTSVSSLASAVFTTTVDRIAPTITAEISDINGAVTGGSTAATPFIQGTTNSSLAPTDEVHVYRRAITDTGSSVEIGKATINSGTSWSYTDSSALVDGITYIYSVAVWDAAGNPGLVSPKEYRIAFDSASAAPPVITGISLDTGTSASDGITFDQNLDIDGTGEAGASIQVFRDGVSIGTTTANFAGVWKFNHTATTLGNGTYTFTAKQTDVAGNPPSGLSAGFLVTVDASTVGLSTAATFISTVADNTGGITGNLTSGGVTDATSLTLSGSISFAMNAGEVVGVYDGATRLGTATMTGATTWTYTDTTLLDTDVVSYKARVEDLAGNGTTFSAVFAITIDTLVPENEAVVTAVTDNFAPGIGVIAPGDPTNDPTPTVSGTIAQALSVPLDTGASVHVYRNGILLPGAATVITTTWTYTDTLPAGDGLYNYTAAVWDTAGNPAFVDASYLNDYIIDAQFAPPILNPGGTSFASGVNAVVTIDFSEIITATDAGGSPITTDGGIPGGLVIQQNGAGGNIIFPVATGTTVTPAGLTMNTNATLAQTDFLLISYDTAVAGGIIDVWNNEVASLSWVIGGTGNNTINMGAYATRALHIEGMAGDDTITGSTAFADTLSGGDGDDTFIYATAASFFAAGAVVDSINGGAGTDTVQVTGVISLSGADPLARMTGVERLVATDTAALAYNIVLGTNTGLDTIDLSLNTNAGSTAVIDLTGVTTNMTVKGVSAGANTITAGTGADIITGGSTDTFIYAASSDFANGTALTDTIDGGAGADKIQIAGAIALNLTTLSGLTAVEQLVAAADTAALTHSIALSADSSLNTINLSANTSAGSSSTINLTGVTTAMTITGLSSADTITAGSGNDTFVYAAAGDFYNGAAVTDSIDGGLGTDSIQIAGAISLNLTDLTRLTSVERLVAATSTGVLAHNITVGANSSLNTIDLSLTNGVVSAGSTAVIDLTGVTTDMTIKGVGAGTGFNYKNTIIGGTGSDTITGGGSNDLFVYNALSDFISTGTGVVVDSISAGLGIDKIQVAGAIDLGYTNANDTLAGRLVSVEQLVAASSSADLAHHIVLNADAKLGGVTTIDLSPNTGAGSSSSIVLTGVTTGMTLTGGSGIDTITAGSGNDTFHFNASSDFSNGAAVIDSIDGGVGTADKIQIAGAITLTGSLAGAVAVEQLVAASSTVTLANSITAITNIASFNTINLSPNGSVSSTAVIDMTGVATGMTITGLRTNTITGGTGVDIITGGTGNDTFIYHAMSDFVTGGAVFDSVNGGGGTNAIWVEGPISLTTADSLARVINTTQLFTSSQNAAPQAHSIVLNTDVKLGSIRSIEFGYDTNATSSALIDLTGVTVAMGWLSGANGANSANTIIGGSGNDVIASRPGTETLSGGAGGIDTFYFFASSDFSNGATVVDSIDGGILTDTAQVVGAITISGSLARAANIEQLLAPTYTGTAAGHAHSITAITDMANFTSISLLADTNTLSTAVIDLTGVATNMTVRGVNGNAATSTNSIIGGAGNDTITGSTTGNDTLDGGAGADSISGGNGANFITGGAGADILIGGTGADTFYYAASSDFVASGAVVDSISASTGTDKIEIAGAISITGTLARALAVEQLVASTQSATGQAHSITGITAISNFTTIDLSPDTNTLSTAEINLTGVATGMTIKGVNGNAATSTNSIIGGSGNDFITGGATGNNTIDGGLGNDSITGGAGNDYINGGDGANSITGGAGVDTLVAGTGADIFYYAAASDFVTAGAVVDAVNGGITGIDSIKVAGAITITGSLAGAVNVEQLLAAGPTGLAHSITAITDIANFTNISLSADTNTLSTAVIDLTGVATNMTVTGVNGNAATSTNSIIGGAGNDTITGSTTGNDTLDGGAGADSISGGNGANFITGGGGADILISGTGADTFYYAASSDFFASGAVVDSISASTGTDKIEIAGAISITGTLARALAAEQLVASTQSATGQAHSITGITAISNFTTIDLSPDTNTLSTAEINLTGVATGMTIKGVNGNAATSTNSIIGGSGNDFITGGATGNNTIDGGLGIDTIFGGAGTDVLAGGGGNDTFYYYAETDFADGAAVIDSIDGGAGTDSVIIQGAISLNAADLSRLTTVEQLAVAANTGATLTHSIVRADTDMGSLTTIDLSLDTNINSSGTFNLAGVSGKTIKGVGAGSNTFIYDAVTEFVTSTAAGVLIDTLTGGTGTDTIQIAGAINLTGTTTLAGLTSVERLVATTQNTTALAHNIVLPINGRLGSVTTVDLSGDSAAGSSSTITLTTQAAAMTIKGVSAGNNTITGGNGADTITGGGVNDLFVYVWGGNLFSAGAVIDSIDGGAGIDTLQVGQGITLSGPDPMSRLINIERLVTTVNTLNPQGYYIALDTDSSLNTIDLSPDTYGANTAYINLTGVTTAMTIKGPVGSGSNTITGGTGADTITASSGNDIFAYNAMSDFISTATGLVIDSISAGGGTADRILIAGAIDLGVTNPGDTLVGRMTLVEQLAAAAQNTSALAHNIVLTDAKRNGINTIDLSLDAGAGSSSSINVSGVTAAMTIKGVGVGSNTLIGGSGNDTLVGGAGADVLDGGGGNDFYYYAAVSDFYSGSGLVDTFVAGAGTNSVQVSGAINLNTLAGLASVQNLTAYNPLTNFTHNITLTDATKGSITTIDLWGDTGRLSSATIDLSGVSTAMTIRGVYGGYTSIYTGTNKLIGGSGDDTITGGVGRDTITGGAGVDVLYGNSLSGYGINIFDYAAMSDFVSGGSVVDSIFGGATTDTVRVAGGITLSTGDSLARMSSVEQLVAAPSSGLLAHSIALTQAQLPVGFSVIDLSGDSYSGSSSTIDMGAVTSAMTLKGVVNGSNTIAGGSGADTITGGAGNDSLTGGDGNNSLTGGAGNDILTGGIGNDTFNGGDGDDSINGGDGNNILSGDTGNDVLTGGIGNDTLTGGAGIDILNGGDGDDAFVYAALADFISGGVLVDAVDGGAGTDTIQLQQLLSTDALTLTTLPGVTGVERLAVSSTWGLTYNFALNETTRNGFDTIDLSGNTGVRSIGLMDMTGVTAAMTIKGVSAGVNTITGGAGADTLTGGAVNDTFIYNAMSDFVSAAGVVLDSINGGGGTADTIRVAGAFQIPAATGSLARIATTELLAAAQSSAVLAHSIALNADANLGSISTIDLSGNTNAGSSGIIDLTGVLTTAMTIKGVGAGNNTLTGGAGNDTLAGGSGIDTLLGADGNDTFVFAALTDFYNGAVVDSIDGGNGIDKIAFESGITLATTDNLNSARLTGVEQLVAVASSASANTYSIALSEAGRGNIDTIDLSGNIRNASTAIIDMSAVTTGMTLKGLSMGRNTITGGAGIDTLTGGYGNDVFVYAAQTDFYSGGGVLVESINGGSGIDLISVGNGITLGITDTLSSTSFVGIEQLAAAAQSSAALAHSIVLDTDAKRGGITTLDLSLDTGAASSGTINLSGVTTAMTIKGVSAGANSITGGSGADTLVGGAVDDTFFYGTSAALIGTLASSVMVDSIAGGGGTADTIHVTGAITITAGASLAKAVTVEQLVAATQNSVNLTHGIALNSDAKLGGIRSIDLSGDTGATSSATITLTGATAAMTLKGVNGATSTNRITGGTGADTITGSSGNDTLTGGAGIDVIDGGDGNNTFVYASIGEFITAGGSVVDSITSGTGTDKIQVTGALTLTTANTLAARTAGIEQLAATTAVTVTANSIVLDTDAKLAGITTIDLSGNTGATSTGVINLTGVTAAMTIKGLSAGANTLTGGTGADTLTGGSANDIFAYNAMSDFISTATGLVVDSINGAAGTADRIQIAGAIDLGVTNTSDTLAGLTLVEQLAAATQSAAVLAHGIVLTEAKLGGITTIDLSLDSNAGSSGNIDLSGVTTGMAIKGVAAGINSIIGGTGNDTFTFVAGTGLLSTDTVNGGAGTDTIALTGLTAISGSDFDNVSNIEVITLQNNTTNVAITTVDALVGNTDTLTLSATGLTTGALTFNGALETGGGKFNITGGGAADVITGGSGNDTLTGGAGTDTITGGAGADVIYLTETTQVIDTVTINAGDSLATGIDQIRNFNATATLNDRLDLPSTTIAVNGATDGANVGSILSHSVTSGKISFDDVNTYAAPLVINAGNIASVNDYLATNIASGASVAFYVDVSGDGLYSAATDYLRVFQGGATAAGTLSTDDIFVDIYTTSGLGGVAALAITAAANTVVIV